LPSIRLIEAGRIRSVVLFSQKRAPNFPRSDHQGGGGSQMAQGRAARLCGPKGLPPEIAAQYETAIRKAATRTTARR